MSAQLSELENLLRQLIAEHRRLLTHVEVHEAAVRRLDLRAMEDSGRQQEASRLRIVNLEQRRRVHVQQMARGMSMSGALTVRNLAAIYPNRAKELLELRTELRGLIEQVASKTNISGKVAAAVLGHLNTMVRLVSGVVERAGLYTKKGTPRVSSRIGVMDALG
ncbi:MAG TPA: flagellar export chaperone FlgN [Tepidisphaeraceae bacterium]|nr:flagellar export chaperone FlgN [Tepidisphaeraceae bacterium]